MSLNMGPSGKERDDCEILGGEYEEVDYDQLNQLNAGTSRTMAGKVPSSQNAENDLNTKTSDF